MAPVTKSESIKELWRDITRKGLERLDALIKDRSIDYLEVRQRAQAMKQSQPFNTSIITLNPKIDSRGQRRLQCSLSFTKVFKYFAPEADPKIQTPPVLWGVPYTVNVASKPRSFKQ